MTDAAPPLLPMLRKAAVLRQRCRPTAPTPSGLRDSTNGLRRWLDKRSSGGTIVHCHFPGSLALKQVRTAAVAFAEAGTDEPVEELTRFVYTEEKTS